VAAIVYTVNHAFIKSAFLMLVGVVSSHTQTKTADFSQIVGAGTRLPRYIGVLYLLGGMALAGVPPMNGFISKFLLVRSGIEAEEWVSVGLAASAGLLTLYYVTRTWQLIFQQKPTDQTVGMKDIGDKALAPLLLIGISVLLGVWATPLYDVADTAVESLLKPEIYIEAVGVNHSRIFGG
jgi:multicomponent Na+:H+ antiporter subunit D